YIMRLDTNFNILDTTFFQFSGERTSAISVTQAANTDLLVTGTVYWLDTIRQERRKGFLAARFDAQLNLKWIKRFHTPSVNGKTVEQQAYHIKEDWFGDILLSGYRQAISGDNSADGLILKIDSTGQLLWQQLIGGSSFDDDIINIELTPDSTYFISTSFGVELLDLGASDIRSKKVNRFLVLDTNGLVVWDKLYHVPLPSNFVSDLVKVNNGMVTMGSYIDWDTDWQTRDALFRSYTFKTDFKGDSIWYREYVAGTFQSDWNILYDLAATSDGGLVAGGHFLSHNNSPLTGQGGSHVWIVRTDSMGCVVQGCQYISTEEPIELAGITVYPNPAQSHITLSLLPTSEPVDLSIYNTQGQIVKQCMNTHANDQVLINDLIKGLYLVQFSREGQTLGEERLLIE
ncbi:MAG: T9SS type A sorting domain-containing protein, partial [Owenweeksia sp.]